MRELEGSPPPTTQRSLRALVALCALAGLATLAWAAQAGAPDTAQTSAPPAPKVELLQARKDLPVGAFLSIDDVERVQVAVDQAPPFALRASAFGERREVLRPIAGGAWIPSGAVKRWTASPAESLREDGARLYMLPVSPELAEQVRVGDRVDVLGLLPATVDGEPLRAPSPVPNRAATLLAQRVRVLGIHKNTLALELYDGEVSSFDLARADGSVRVTLRARGDMRLQTHIKSRSLKSVLSDLELYEYRREHEEQHRPRRRRPLCDKWSRHARRHTAHTNEGAKP